MAKSTVRTNALRPTRWVALTTVIALSTGPAQGTKMTPSPRPSTKAPAFPLGCRRTRWLKGRSSRCPRRGTISPAATRPRTTSPASRRKSWGSPSALSSEDPANVNVLKLSTSPAMTAYAR